MEKKTFVSRLEVKLAASETETATKSFVGYGAYFDNVDFDGDIIAKGAFAASLSRHKAAGTMPLMLLNHDAWDTLPIGVWKSMVEDDRGLVVEGELLDTNLGGDVYKALKAGAITGLSVGFRCTGYEMDGRKRTITEADLMEISVVTFPANDLARVNDVKSMTEDDAEAVMDDEALSAALAKAGFGEEAITALFESREVEEDDGNEADEEENLSANTSHESEAKYDEAGLVAAIRKSVETIKEMYVR